MEKESRVAHILPKHYVIEKIYILFILINRFNNKVCHTSPTEINCQDVKNIPADLKKVFVNRGAKTKAEPAAATSTTCTGWLTLT